MSTPKKTIKTAKSVKPVAKKTIKKATTKPIEKKEEKKVAPKQPVIKKTAEKTNVEKKVIAKKVEEPKKVVAKKVIATPKGKKETNKTVSKSAQAKTPEIKTPKPAPTETPKVDNTVLKGLMDILKNHEAGLKVSVVPEEQEMFKDSIDAVKIQIKAEEDKGAKLDEEVIVSTPVIKPEIAIDTPVSTPVPTVETTPEDAAALKEAIEKQHPEVTERINEEVGVEFDIETKLVDSDYDILNGSQPLLKHLFDVKNQVMAHCVPDGGVHNEILYGLPHAEIKSLIRLTQPYTGGKINTYKKVVANTILYELVLNNEIAQIEIPISINRSPGVII
jgi:hypothetical protein